MAAEVEVALARGDPARVQLGGAAALAQRGVHGRGRDRGRGGALLVRSGQGHVEPRREVGPQAHVVEAGQRVLEREGRDVQEPQPRAHVAAHHVGRAGRAGQGVRGARPAGEVGHVGERVRDREGPASPPAQAEQDLVGEAACAVARERQVDEGAHLPARAHAVGIPLRRRCARCRAAARGRAPRCGPARPRGAEAWPAPAPARPRSGRGRGSRARGARPPAAVPSAASSGACSPGRRSRGL